MRIVSLLCRPGLPSPGRVTDMSSARPADALDPDRTKMRDPLIPAPWLDVGSRTADHRTNDRGVGVSRYRIGALCLPVSVSSGSCLRYKQNGLSGAAAAAWTGPKLNTPGHPETKSDPQKNGDATSQD